MITSLGKVKRIPKKNTKSTKSTKRRSTKKSTKKSTKRRSVKKSTKIHLTNKSTKSRSTKKSTKSRSTKKKSYDHNVITSAESKYKKNWKKHVPENLHEKFKDFIKDFDKVDSYLGHMPGHLSLYDYYDNNQDEINKKLESMLEKDNFLSGYEIYEYYDMIDKIKFLIKSDKNMKKIILIELKYGLVAILNNLKKKVPELFR